METTKQPLSTHNIPSQAGEVPGAVVGEYPQAAYNDPAAEYARSLEQLDRFKAGIGTSAEEPAYQRHMAEKAAADEAAEKARISAEVAREAHDIRSGVYNDAHLNTAKKIAELAQANGGRLYIHSSDPSKRQLSGWDAVQVLADHAGKQAQEAHDQMITREIAFTGAKEEADWDEIVRVMDEAYGTAENSDDWREFEGYAKRLSPKMQNKYADHREALEAAAAQAEEPQPEPEPTDPEPTPQPPAKPPRRPDQEAGAAVQPPAARGRAKVSQAPRHAAPGSGRRSQDDGSHRRRRLPLRAQTPETSDSLKNRMIRFANSDITYERPQGKGRWSPKTMKHWMATHARKLAKSGLQSLAFTDVERSSRQEPQAPQVPQTPRQEVRTTRQERNAAAKDTVRRLSLQGPFESDKDYEAEVEREFNSRKGAWRRYAEKHPLSPNFDLTTLFIDAARRSTWGDNDGKRGHTFPMEMEEMLGELQNDYDISRYEATVLADHLIREGGVEELVVTGRDGKPMRTSRYEYARKPAGRERIGLAA